MKKMFLILALALGIASAAPVGSALAFDIFPNHAVDCSNEEQAQSAVCAEETDQDPISGTNGTLIKVTRIVAFFAGAAAIIVMLVAGLYYITSDGDSAKIKNAKSAFINVLIGLVIIMIAQALIVFVLRRV